MMFGWLILLVIVVVAIWYFTNNGNFPSQKPPKENPLDALKRRYANGEISKEEYEERKAVLEEKG